MFINLFYSYKFEACFLTYVCVAGLLNDVNVIQNLNGHTIKFDMVCQCNVKRCHFAYFSSRDLTAFSTPTAAVVILSKPCPTWSA